MPSLIVLPKLFQSMKNGTMAAWLVEPGAFVEEGKPLCDITTHKVTLEVEAPVSGYLRTTFPVPGDRVPVNAPIAVITPTPDEAIAESMLSTIPEYGPAPRYEGCKLPDYENLTITPIGGMREIIADHMTFAKDTIPHFYLTTIVNMSGAMELRTELKKDKLRISYNDMLIKAVAVALDKYPRVAAMYTTRGFIERNRMNVGFAVVVGEDGLVVPVIRDADKKTLAEVSQEAKDLATKARNKKLTPEDYGDSVFTVSNLGSYDVDQFTAIAIPGESGILAVGKVTEYPVVVKGEIVIQPMMKITLSSDHRVIDGVLAAHFCSYVKQLMETPQRLI